MGIEDFDTNPQMNVLLQSLRNIDDKITGVSQEVSEIKGTVIYLEKSHKDLGEDQDKLSKQLDEIQKELNQVSRGEYCVKAVEIKKNADEIIRLREKLDRKLERVEDKRETGDHRIVDKVDTKYERTVDNAVNIGETKGKIWATVKVIAIVIASLMFLFMFAKTFMATT